MKKQNPFEAKYSPIEFLEYLQTCSDKVIEIEPILHNAGFANPALCKINLQD